MDNEFHRKSQIVTKQLAGSPGVSTLSLGYLTALNALFY
jgi:hypothetical protein